MKLDSFSGVRKLLNAILDEIEDLETIDEWMEHDMSLESERIAGGEPVDDSIAVFGAIDFKEAE